MTTALAKNDVQGSVETAVAALIAADSWLGTAASNVKTRQTGLIPEVMSGNEERLGFASSQVPAILTIVPSIGSTARTEWADSGQTIDYYIPGSVFVVVESHNGSTAKTACEEITGRVERLLRKQVSSVNDIDGLDGRVLDVGVEVEVFRNGQAWVAIGEVRFTALVTVIND